MPVVILTSGKKFEFAQGGVILNASAQGKITISYSCKTGSFSTCKCKVDCCDVMDATYNGQLRGAFGDIATLNFYSEHPITVGEGGAVFTNNVDDR